MIEFFSKYNIEIISMFFSFFYVFFVIKKNNYLIMIWILAFVYSICFEFINSYFTGTYEYQIFLIGFFGIPFYVPMMRANLLTWVISKKECFNWISVKVGMTNSCNKYFLENLKGKLFGKNELLKSLFFAFFGSLFILSFDIVIDVIAVQQNLRTRYFNISQGRYGVNYGNFVGRFVVSFLFIFGILFIEKKYNKTILNYIIFGIIFPLIIQTFLFVVPFVFNLQKDYKQQFSYFFLIPVLIIFGGSFLFLKINYYGLNSCFYRNNKETLQGQKNIKKRLFSQYNIATEIFFIIIHWYSVCYFVFQYFDLLLFMIALSFSILHTLFLVYNLNFKWTRKQKY